MRYERWVQHNLIRDEGRLPAPRELTQWAPVEKTAALSTELRARRRNPRHQACASISVSGIRGRA